MTRTLLTGGSGFIASHILDELLKRGHSVVTTVRSQEKADRIRESHPSISKDNLDFVIVPDVSAPDGIYNLYLFCILQPDLTLKSSLRQGRRC